MTASTNLVLIEKPNGSIAELNGVMYAETALRARDKTPGIAVQYTSEASVDGDPETEFIEHGELIGVYDEMCEDPLNEDYYEAVNQ